MGMYSRARLIRTANARKNHANYLSMWIIRAYFALSNITLWKVVSWTTMRIIQGVRISEGQIIRATLYWGHICMHDMKFLWSNLWARGLSTDDDNGRWWQQLRHTTDNSWLHRLFGMTANKNNDSNVVSSFLCLTVLSFEIYITSQRFTQKLFSDPLNIVNMKLVTKWSRTRINRSWLHVFFQSLTEPLSIFSMVYPRVPFLRNRDSSRSWTLSMFTFEHAVRYSITTKDTWVTKDTWAN